MITEPVPDTARVWLIPSKFWRATRHMNREEVGEFMEHIYALAECRDYAALQRYDFIRVGTYRELLAS